MNKKLALLSLSLLMAGGAVAQNTTTGQVIGHVSDPDGQPVARAAVKVGERVVAVTDKTVILPSLSCLLALVLSPLATSA